MMMIFRGYKDEEVTFSRVHLQLFLALACCTLKSRNVHFASTDFILQSSVLWFCTRQGAVTSSVPWVALIWELEQKLYCFRTIYLFSHHQLLGAVVMRDYDFLSPKYSLKHISPLSLSQLLCRTLSGTRKHASSTPLASAHLMFPCVSPVNKVVLKGGIQKGRVVTLSGFGFFMFNVTICFWAGAGN